MNNFIPTLFPGSDNEADEAFERELVPASIGEIKVLNYPVADGSSYNPCIWCRRGFDEDDPDDRHEMRGQVEGSF